MWHMTDLIDRPSTMTKASRAVTERPASSVLSLILLALIGYSIYRMWPEVQRYIRIERM